MPMRIIAEWMENDPVIRAVNWTIATASISSPWWRQYLHEWSAVAAEAAPFFAIGWFIVQGWCKIYVTFYKRRVAEEE